MPLRPLRNRLSASAAARPAVATLAVLFLALGAAGCVSEKRAPRRPLLARSEPGSIVLRNETDQALFDLSIRPAGTRSADGGGRIGRFSSVPPGSDQFVSRPETAPPLPDAFDVAWSDARGARFAHRVSLKQVKSAGHPTDATLYIRILSPQDVVAVVPDATQR
jgi:hypothetical protein